MKIAICRCHKPSAKGAINKKYNLNEYDEAEKVNVHLVRMLIDAGHEVHSFEGSLTGKVHKINAGRFDLAIEPHFNADYDHLDPNDCDDSRGRGAMVMFCPRAKTYYDKEPLSDRRDQASLMSRAFSRKLGNPDLGGRRGFYWGPETLDANGKPTLKDYFLRKTNCPAFIPEPGYIENTGDWTEWLVSTKHHGIAQAIADGVKASFGGKS